MSVAGLLADLARLGIEVVAHEDRLRYRPRSALTPDLAKRLRTHRAELLAILGPAVAPDGATTTPAAGEAERAERRPGVAPEARRWEDCIDPPDPCPECGGLVFWWNPLGDRRCTACDPPTTAIRALERTERIRRRCGKSSPVGAAETLAGLKRLTNT